MNTIKTTSPGMLVPRGLDGTIAVYVVSADKYHVLNGRVEPEVHDGVVEQVGHGRLDGQGINIQRIIPWSLFHEEYTFNRRLMLQCYDTSIKDVSGR